VRTSLYVVLASVIALLVGAPAAHAAPTTPPVYPPNPPTIDVESGSVPPGGNQTVTVTGFCSGVTVTFTLNPGGIVLGTAVANASGTASLTFKAPTTVGTYTVTATAPNTCGGGGTTTETTDFDVAQLPSSGTDSQSLLRWAATVLGVGVALVAVALVRRRSTRQPA
jgi:hypothetical protein